MLTIEDIRLKAATMERLAREGDEVSAPAYRQMALEWRLLEIQTVFMDAMMQGALAEAGPTA
jgi:hypothetical protein